MIAQKHCLFTTENGYMLYFSGAANAINATLYRELSFDFVADFAPVASIASGTGVMEVNTSFPAKTLQEFIAYAKANPGMVKMGSAGLGNVTQMFGELFKMSTGIDMLHVPFQGETPALVELLAGRIDVYFGSIGAAKGHIQEGKLRALGVTTRKRLDALPDVPSINEVVPGYEAMSWFGLSAPKDTPAEIVNKLNATVNAALADPAIEARFETLALTPIVGTPADYKAFVDAETEKWAKVVKATGAKAG